MKKLMVGAVALLGVACGLVSSALATETAKVTYTWTGAGDGTSWTDTANWQGNPEACFGYPDDSTNATAVFSAEIESPLTITGADRQFKMSDVFFRNAAAITFDGGSYSKENTTVQGFEDGAELILDNGASFTFRSFYPGSAKDVRVTVRNGSSFANGTGRIGYSDKSSNIVFTVEGEGSVADFKSNTAQNPSVKGADHVWRVLDKAVFKNSQNQGIFSDTTRYAVARPTIVVSNATFTTTTQFWYGLRSDADSSTLVLEGESPLFSSASSGSAIVLGTNTAETVTGMTTVKYVVPAAGWTTAPIRTTWNKSPYGKIILGEKAEIVVDATGFVPPESGASVTMPLMEATGVITTAPEQGLPKFDDVRVPEGYVGSLSISEDYKQLLLTIERAGDFVIEVDGFKYETIEEALDKIADGSAVKLLKDATLTQALVLDNKSFTFDLGGFTLTAAEDATAISASGESSLTLRNGSVVAEGGAAIVWQASGMLLVDGATVSGLTGVYAKSGYVAVNEGSTVLSTAETWVEPTADSIGQGGALVLENDGTLSATVLGGTFTTAAEGGKAVYSWAQEGTDPLGGFVFGGTFNTELLAEYCYDGVEPVDNGDGTWTTKVVRDFRKVTYTWTGAGDGESWNDKANWSASISQCMGYPDSQFAVAVIGDATKAVRLTGDGETTYAVTNLTFGASSNVTLANLNLTAEDDITVTVGATLVLDATSLTIPSWANVKFGTGSELIYLNGSQFSGRALAKHGSTGSGVTLKIYDTPEAKFNLRWTYNKTHDPDMIALSNSTATVQSYSAGEAFNFDETTLMFGQNGRLVFGGSTPSAVKQAAAGLGRVQLIDVLVPAEGFTAETAPISTAANVDLKMTNAIIKVDATACQYDDVYPLVALTGEEGTMEVDLENVVLSEESAFGDGCTGELVMSEDGRALCLKVTTGVEPPPFTVTVEAAPENATVTVLSNGTVVAFAESYTGVKGHDKFTVTYAADEGYAFADGAVTEFTLAKDGDEAVAPEAPTAIEYAITYADIDGWVEGFEPVESYTIESETIVLPTEADVKARLGATFKGWTNELGQVVTEVEQGTTGDLAFYAVWEQVTPPTPGGNDPTTDDPTQIGENEKAGDRYGDKVPEELANASAKAIALWCQGEGNVSSGDAIITKAFLLNCENTDAAVEVAEENFKFTSFVPGETPSIDGDFTGEVVVKAYADVRCTEEVTPSGEEEELFYKAFLVVKEVPAE